MATAATVPPRPRSSRQHPESGDDHDYIPKCGVGGTVDNDIPVNRVSIDRNVSKMGTLRDTVLDGVGIRGL